MDNWTIYALANLKKGGGGGGGSAAADPNAPVRFLDYDGTVLYSYTPEEFASISEMPANPTHEGLTSQGWNYSVEKAQSYVKTYGRLDIGQMYITDDGKTRIHISLEDGRLSPTFGMDLCGTCAIDWGDNTTSTLKGKGMTPSRKFATHTYTKAGDYIITLEPTYVLLPDTWSLLTGVLTAMKGSKYTSAAPVYSNAVKKIYMGQITGKYFMGCGSLTSVTIPAGVTSIADSAFKDCRSLTSVTIPSSVTSIGTSAFEGCGSLASVAIPSSVTGIGRTAFADCGSLTSVNIPSGLTVLDSYIFEACKALSNVTIPSGITDIGGDVFRECRSLVDITIPSTVSVIGGGTFQDTPLRKITLPYNVQRIGAAMFRGCDALSSIVIQSTVTAIAEEAFKDCYGLGFIKFEPTTPPAFQPTTPPTVTPIAWWENISTDCIIRVPANCLDLYTSAEGYPPSDTYQYVEG
jgi:hypothetical protein